MDLLNLLRVTVAPSVRSLVPRRTSSPPECYVRLPCCALGAVAPRAWCSSDSSSNSHTHTQEEDPHKPQAPPVEGRVTLSVFHGFPQLTVPLPSRRERCRFTLRPISHTVRDLVEQLQHEDHGVDRVVLRATDGVRISSSDSIESLLREDFDIVINDVAYRVQVPPSSRLTQEEVNNLGDVRHLVNKLYAALNVDEHHVLKEREIVTQIEQIKSALIPLEKKRESLAVASQRRTNVLAWAGLGYMALQFGFLARLTWWEYSWDIMEPVTYFVTYGTAIAAYAYFVLTRTDFALPQVHDRQFLLSFYKKAKKEGIDVEKYNELKTRLAQLETDLERLHDPLALNYTPKAQRSRTNVHLGQRLKSLLGMKESP